MVACLLIGRSPYDSRIARVSRNASIPYWPYSRPTPEYLNPPQGACGSSVMPLITTRPARNCEGHTARAADVGPDDSGVKAISGVVGERDRFVLGDVGDERPLMPADANRPLAGIT